MSRVWHHWETWECVKAGMYSGSQAASDEGRELYRQFLADTNRFDVGIRRVFREWPISCEQFLTNCNINQIAWLGQASMCIEHNVSRSNRSGFNLLSCEQQRSANQLAQHRISEWKHGHAAQSFRVHRDLEAKRIPERHTRGSSRCDHERAPRTFVQGYMFSNS